MARSPIRQRIVEEDGKLLNVWDQPSRKACLEENRERRKVNPRKSDQKYIFDPKIALFKLEFESAQPGGEAVYVPSFDPREIIKARKEQLGGEIGLEEYFQGKDIMPGETIETYILFPKSVDFSKVKALWMNSSKIPEVKQ